MTHVLIFNITLVVIFLLGVIYLTLAYIADLLKKIKYLQMLLYPKARTSFLRSRQLVGEEGVEILIRGSKFTRHYLYHDLTTEKVRVAVTTLTGISVLADIKVINKVSIEVKTTKPMDLIVRITKA